MGQVEREYKKWLRIATIFILIFIGLGISITIVMRYTPNFSMDDSDDLGNGGYLLNNDLIFKDSIITENKYLISLIIPDHIKNYMYDDNYILVEQVPKDFHHATDYWNSDSVKYNNDSIVELKKKCYAIGDCYWIIDKKKDEVLGPYNKQEYDAMVEKMGIKIKLDPKYERQ